MRNSECGTKNMKPETRNLKLIGALLALFAASILTGCGSLYVNLPPLPGDMATHWPNDNNVRTIEAAALVEVLKRYPPTGSYAIKLPAGTNSQTHNFVLAALPQSETIGESSDPLPIYRVAELFIRGSHAYVDVVIPPQGISRNEALVTVYLAPAIVDGWTVTYSRLWNIEVEKALRLTRPSDIPLVVEPQPESPTPIDKPLESSDSPK